VQPTQLERVLARQRKELIKIDNEGAAEIVSAWRDLNKYLNQQLQLLLDEIGAKGKISKAELRRMVRYQQLLKDVERESLKFADAATKTIKDSQVRALSLVNAHTREATIESLGGRAIPEIAVATVQSQFGRLPAQAYMQLVGNASDGKPLGELLKKIAPKAKREAADVLTRGIAQGHNPRKIARAFKSATGVSYTRAETISRTEVIRAYREAALETYRTSPIVTEWVWVAALDTRTCFACAQMSGTVHPMSESLNGHPRCRCAMAPKTKTWEELGFKGIPDTNPKIPSGREWFDRLSEQDKVSMLGQGKYDALKSGQVTHKDLVAKPRNRTWGPMVRNASLNEARAASKQR
jgi:SPP1 gp7 family putative phage head morphogenesis protein